MPKLIQVQEHELIPLEISLPVWQEGMRLPAQSEGLDRWFFRWQWGGAFPINSSSEECSGEGYYASYVIGAQWIDSTPLVITPKGGCDKIDYLKMLATCLNSGIESKELSKIYGVDLEQPRIEAPELNSVLSPLIIVHFISLVREIIKRGLKKSYVSRESNLKKVRGRIAISQNEHYNVMRKRCERVYCKYQEYSADTPENRLIKKALLFSRQIIAQIAQENKSLHALHHAINQCISAFCDVSDQIEVWEIKSMKRHKLFRGYEEAVQIAQMILRWCDYSITSIRPAAESPCPVFWLDMSLLYEHYVLGLLREAYGEKIKYQAKGYTGYPDFICYDPKLVMDTKYIPRFQQGGIDIAIARQLAGYARDRKLFRLPASEVIPCIVIYPKEGEAQNPFKDKSLEELLAEDEDRHLFGFYRIAVPLPTLNEPETNLSPSFT